MERISVKIVEDKLNFEKCYNFVAQNSCGGIASFIGTVRNQTKNKAVSQLEFTGYKAMAIKEMKKICELAISKFDIEKIAVHHALGMLKVGEIPVIITVSSAHRNAAFDACKFTIDTLKETVPIWKKEYFEDGEVWVNAHP
ncbi:MAG TPA: molybdenum cofactor biosynthesis protein MoaE [Flavobacteriaceae bacterium]|nr:molybdenum cofactor biosynthesis protein MoaE [Flavobacteriaceae bacterium]